MSSRGFSLASGLLVVAAVLSTFMLPIPLSRARASIGQYEFSATREAARMACIEFGPVGLVRLLRGHLSRAHHRAPSAPSQVAGPAAPRPAADAWTTVARGIDYRRVRVTGDVELYQVRLDPARADVRLIPASPHKKRNASVLELARHSGAIAAANACYFGEDDQPLGYLKIDGKVIVPWVATGAAFTGMFTLSGGKARIVPRDRFRAAEAETALQAGPRLVADGVPTVGLRETRSFRQTGIAVTRSGRVVIYATHGSYRGLTWEKTRQVLLGSPAEGGIEPRDVLNLDGGSSSQLVIRTAREPIVTGMYTAVPVAVGFFARR